MAKSAEYMKRYRARKKEGQAPSDNPSNIPSVAPSTVPPKEETSPNEKGLKIGDEVIVFDGVLKTSGKSRELKGVYRKQVEAWESKWADAKVEHGALYDYRGTLIYDKKGGKTSVSYDHFAFMRAEVNTHIHPRENGTLGGTFSETDLRNFAVSDNLRTVRAVAKEGTYTFTRKDGFNPREFNSAMRKANKEERSKYIKAVEAEQKEYSASKITYAELEKRAQKHFNNYLVNWHNWFLKNQKTYNYQYGLEKR